MRRIGLLMGTFDPLTIAHLQSGMCAAEQYELDMVLIIPNGNPVHKDGVLDAELRYQMIKAAIRGNRKFQVSRIELDREGPSYTVDTLRTLKEQYGTDVELFLIIGDDNLDGGPWPVRRWKEPEQVCQLCHFLVVPRALSSERLQDLEWVRAQLPDGARVDMVDCPGNPISSTQIRQWFQAGRFGSARYHLPPAVYRYILQHGLYQSANEQPVVLP